VVLKAGVLSLWIRKNSVEALEKIFFSVRLFGTSCLVWEIHSEKKYGMAVYSMQFVVYEPKVSAWENKQGTNLPIAQCATIASGTIRFKNRRYQAFSI